MYRVRFVASLWLVLIAVFLLAQRSSALATEGVVEIGSRLELLTDEYLIDCMTGGARLELHRPRPREVAIVHDEPWEGNTSGYHTVIEDGDVYRMYYRGHQLHAEPSGLRGGHREVTCYAQSPDGIHWTKPKLGLFEFDGSKANNIIWQDMGSHNFTPFIDANPACKPDARYKAVGGTGKQGLNAFKSADGIHWTRLADRPVFTKGAFDSQNLAFWDSARKRYTAYFRFFTTVKGKGLRAIGMTHSSDFLDWADPVPLQYPGSQAQQMYTNQIIPYYRAPHILMGFPTRYVARDLTDHAKTLDPVPLRTRLTKALRRIGSDLTDGLFMTSRDAVTFKRWDEAFLRPGPQQEHRWLYGDNYQSLGLVETPSATPGGPKEISFYCSEGSWREGETRQRRYSIRIDGFVSLAAPLAGGEAVTRPLQFAGSKLIVSYATSAAGSLRVEIQDAAGEPLAGYSLADCRELYGDTIEQTVSWNKGPDVGPLAGRPVRLRFVLCDADLYSFRFR